MDAVPRIALVVSHPIQHFSPQYVSLAAAADWRVKVFFASAMGKKPYHDSNFGQSLAWAGLSLHAFDHLFLSEEALPSSAGLDAPGLNGALADYDPDVVVVYGYWQKVQRRAMTWARAARRRIYYISDSELAHRPGRLKTFAKTLVLRRRLAPVSRFLTVGTWNEAFYRRCGVPPVKMTRMNFPIDVAAYDATLKDRAGLRRSRREALGFGENDFVVSTVGKLVPWKRQVDLVRAVMDAPRESWLKALIIGSGPDEAALKALAGNDERVRLAGFVPPEELPGLYAASDAYTHLSAYEPHSLAISEATYVGLPVVLSDRCGSYGPNDDVEPGVNGLVYPVSNVVALAAALGRLAADRHLAARFGECSRAYAQAAQARAHGGFLREALAADATGTL
jgi:glycosyltransferase involved in cell wall biosynthesis